MHTARLPPFTGLLTPYRVRPTPAGGQKVSATYVSGRLSARRRWVSYASPTLPAMMGVVVSAPMVPDLLPLLCRMTGFSVATTLPRNAFTPPTMSFCAVALSVQPAVARLADAGAGRYQRPRPLLLARLVSHVTTT